MRNIGAADLALKQKPFSFPPFLSTSLHIYFLPSWKVCFSSVNPIGNIGDSGLGLGNTSMAQGGKVFQEQLTHWKSVLGMEAKDQVKKDGQLY